MVRPVVGHHVEAEPVLQDGLHLTREQVDLAGRLALVRVADLEEAVPDLAPPLLPDVSQPALGPLEEVAGLSVAQRGVALGLVQRVLARGNVAILKEEEEE